MEQFAESSVGSLALGFSLCGSQKPMWSVSIVAGMVQLLGLCGGAGGLSVVTPQVCGGECSLEDGEVEKGSPAFLGSLSFSLWDRWRTALVPGALAMCP